MPANENLTLLEVLSRLSAGEISLDAAALMLETDSSDLIQLIESSPSLVEAADALGNERRLDPKRTIERSHEGLASAVEHLSTRIQTDGHDMAVSELVAASKVLEGLVAFSKQRESEIKSDHAKSEGGLPLVILDRREGGFRVFMVPPGSSQWVDTRLPEFQEPNFSWLDQFAPIVDGEVVGTKALLADGVRYMDSRGRIFGGC